MSSHSAHRGTERGPLSTKPSRGVALPDNLPLLLLQVRDRVLARFRPVLNAHEVTEQQWRIIRALAERGPMEPREIVAACCISGPSLAGVLVRMQELGLVTRERLENDQRRLRISPSAKGRALVNRMIPHIAAIYMALEGELGEDILLRLREALRDTLTGMDADTLAARAAADD